MFFWGSKSINNISSGYSSAPIDNKKILTVKEWLYHKKYSGTHTEGSYSVIAGSAVGTMSIIDRIQGGVNGIAIGRESLKQTIAVEPGIFRESSEENVTLKPIKQ